MHIDIELQSASEHYQSGQLEEAEKICSEILKNQPDNYEATHLLGLISYKSGALEAALRYMRKAIKLDPDNADLYFDLGNILQEQGHLTRAITNYKKAIKLDAGYAEAYNNIGIAFQDNMQLEKAIKSYKDAIRTDPGYAEAYNNLGVAFQEKKQLDKAINHFQKALLLKPGYSNAYNNMVEAVQGKGYENRHAFKKNDIYAVYRGFYGEDFLPLSLASVQDYVKKIFIFWDKTPSGDLAEYTYKGEPIQFPKKFDNAVKQIKELNNPKIELLYEHRDNPENQLTHFVNDIILRKFERPSIIVFLEVDHVFREDQLQKALDEFIEQEYVFATTHQIEVWKGLRHRVPDRPQKVGAVFCNLSKLDEIPETLKHGGILVMPKLSAHVHNVGFAVSEKIMYWKHILSLAKAQKSGDTIPSEDWYEKKWLSWDYESNNENLDISEAEKIGSTVPYNTDELPEVIQARYDL
jgi:tetratricopeptide (TPR) repeat protein